jgi:N-carbamoylputrescine amidase
MSASPDPDKNLQRAIDRLHQAQAKGAQIVCLPELFQTKYFYDRRRR